MKHHSFKKTAALAPSSPDRTYYRLLRRRARTFKIDLPRKQWCDLWHTHFDWEGHGDLSRIHRRKHLIALFSALSRARRELASQTTPYQLFAAVYPTSSADDALYVHTKNPNSTPFPYTFPGALPATTLPPLLASFVNLRYYDVLKAPANSGLCYLIVAR